MFPGLFNLIFQLRQLFLLHELDSLILRLFKALALGDDGLVLGKHTRILALQIQVLFLVLADRIECQVWYLQIDHGVIDWVHRFQVLLLHMDKV